MSKPRALGAIRPSTKAAEAQKTIALNVSEPDLWCLYFHLSQNVAPQNPREQDEYEVIWQSLHCDDLRDKGKETGKERPSEDDFDERIERPVVLTREEIGYLFKFLGRPAMGPLSRVLRRIRIAVEDLRDGKGLRPHSGDEPSADGAA